MGRSAVLLAGLIVMAAVGCGSGRTHSVSRREVSTGAIATAPSGSPRAPAPDPDQGGDRRLDPDDGLASLGHAASSPIRRAVTRAVKRYYAVAVRGDGHRACELMFLLLAESIVPSFGEPPGPRSLRGRTCGSVMTKLFRQRHGHLAREAASLKVVGVRVQGNRAYALLQTRPMSVGRVLLRRQHGVWKLDELYGGPFQ